MTGRGATVRRGGPTYHPQPGVPCLSQDRMCRIGHQLREQNLVAAFVNLPARRSRSVRRSGSRERLIGEHTYQETTHLGGQGWVPWEATGLVRREGRLLKPLRKELARPRWVTEVKFAGGRGRRTTTVEVGCGGRHASFTCCGRYRGFSVADRQEPTIGCRAQASPRPGKRVH